MATLESVPQADSSTPTAIPGDDVGAWSRQYDQQQAVQKSQELLPKQEAPHPFQAVRDWVSSLPDKISSPALDTAMQAVGSLYGETGDAARDVVVGVVKGAVNTVKAADLVVNGPGLPESQIWTHAQAAAQDFTDAVKVKDPTLQDNLIQYAAQVAPSYLLASKMLNSVHGVANAVAAGAAADASALDPHAPRFADILGVLKQTDGKIGQALRAAGPYGLNAYINYLGSNANETEAQGRFKNALDGILPNFIGTELLHAAGITVKQGYKGLRSMVAQGATSAADLVPAVDPAEQMATDQARTDMEAAAANPNGKRPPLNQSGVDPAQAIIEEQARRDMAANPPPATLYHGSPQKGITALEPGEKLAARGHGIYLSDDPAVAGAYTPSAGGGLYKVEVPGEHVAGMLHWDEPLTHQPIAEHAFEQLGIDSKGMSAGEAYRALSEKLSPPTGEPGSNTKFNKEGDKAASKALAQAGVPGIRYSSSGKYSQRGATGNNIVVFDPKHAKVIGER